MLISEKLVVITCIVLTWRLKMCPENVIFCLIFACFYFYSHTTLLVLEWQQVIKPVYSVRKLAQCLSYNLRLNLRLYLEYKAYNRQKSKPYPQNWKTRKIINFDVKNRITPFHNKKMLVFMAFEQWMNQCGKFSLWNMILL